ncbi:transposase [Schnuerera ultunensis]|uniref:Transposase n=1 Tax=[Clostridium] ultunense Esp TaxID=1288971 RepID=A0A1M4PJM3_9FIRM
MSKSIVNVLMAEQLISDNVHSKYTRKIFNGSLDGPSQEIILIVTKFKCKEISCNQKIFTERFSFINPCAHLPNNIIEIIKLLGLSTSAEKASRIMCKFGINISHDTIIRTLGKLPEDLIKVDKTFTNIGVDDFAFRKGKNYCTLICDLDKRKVLQILPGRSKNDLLEWLKNHPQIKLVSRDGSITYTSAIEEVLPKAKQVSDKFHLIKNLLDAISNM